VGGMEGDVISLSDVFAFDHRIGTADGPRGGLRPTGIRPSFSEHLADLGFDLPAEIFADGDIFEALRR
jgi:pilus assembly protein CpaF